MIGTALAVGSSILGAAASANENRKARQVIDDQRLKNREWYDDVMVRDYTQRTDAQSILTKQKEILDEQTKRQMGVNAVTGASGGLESVAAQKEANAKATADTMSNIAANAASYKDQAEQQYKANERALDQQEAQMHQQQAAQIANAAGQAVSAGVNLIGTEISPEVPAGVNNGAITREPLEQAKAASMKATVNTGSIPAARDINAKRNN